MHYTSQSVPLPSYFNDTKTPVLSYHLLHDSSLSCNIVQVSMQKDTIAKQWSAAAVDGCALFPIQCITSSVDLELYAKGCKAMLY